MALEFQTTEDPNSVEEIFCKQLQKGKIESLNEDMGKLLVMLLSSPEMIDPIHKDLSSKSMNLPILENRMKSMGKEMDKGSAIFVSLACETPGEAVMYSYYISYMMKQRELGKTITMDSMFTHIFTFGMFDRDSLEKAWDIQKVKRKYGSDNLLDYPEASKSLVYAIF